jgi:hypothetical protein
MTETATQAASTTETKTTKPKTRKKTAKATPPKTKAPKAAKPKKATVPKEDLMVFAFRMTKVESAALHKAAGPANASRVMRALAAAFVAEDRAVFESIVEDARKLRA